MNKKVAIYCRITKGSDSQTAGFAIEQQIHCLSTFASKNGYSVYKTYSDIGYSGRNMNRPQLLEMLEAAKNGNFDAILTADESRFSRNRSDFRVLPVPLMTPHFVFDRKKTSFCR